MSAGIGYYFGHAGRFEFWALFHTLLGTALIASGTATLNQWYERDVDAVMARTRTHAMEPQDLVKGR